MRHYIPIIIGLAALAAPLGAGTFDPHLLGDINQLSRIVARETGQDHAPPTTTSGKDCDFIGSGNAPYTHSPSDSADAFRSNPLYSAYANNNTAPAGFTFAFRDQKGEPVSDTYMSVSNLNIYSPEDCATLCRQNARCKAFNVYIERDPIYWPAANCRNPPSTSNYRCSLWSSPFPTQSSPQFLRNTFLQQFEVAFAGSNGYNVFVAQPVSSTPASSASSTVTSTISSSLTSISTLPATSTSTLTTTTSTLTTSTTSPTSTPTPGSAPAVPGYKQGQKLPGLINAPLDHITKENTYLRYEFFESQTNVTTCGDACDQSTRWNREHPSQAGKDCNFFVAYILSKNDSPQGLYCALYSQGWDVAYATNNGQYRGSDHYTIASAFAYERV